MGNAFYVLKTAFLYETEPGNATEPPTSSKGSGDVLTAAFLSGTELCDATELPTSSKGNGAVFALVIGIDKYLSNDIPPLTGAVNDATAFRQYLLDKRDQSGLEVPDVNVAFITDENATRHTILSTFESHFLNNDNIPDHGEATMIFFFAGHGSRADAPDNWISSDKKVEVICPVDERMGDEKNYVHAIPDYVLGWLLKKLSEKKGRNIIVILDSCNSGGMGRELRDAGTARTPRSLSNPIPPDLDKHRWEGQTKAVENYRHWRQSETSHVLLAACGEHEVAREMSSDNSIRGHFSESLITRLRKVSVENTTYAELLDGLPATPSQTPHCSGTRKYELVFQNKYPAAGPRSFQLMPLVLDPPHAPSGKFFSVKIGSVAGVVPKTEFSVLTRDNNFVCTLVPYDVKPNQTIFDISANIEDAARAVVADWKNDSMVSIHIPHDLADLFQEPQRKPHRFVEAPSVEMADIILRSHGDEIIVEYHPKALICKGQPRTRFPRSDGKQLVTIVDGIAHFKYFLERRPESYLQVSGFELQMYRLKGDYPKRQPVSSGKNDGNMITNYEVKFASDGKAMYGFTIRNTSYLDLFPYLFYFNPVKYTVESWYSPPAPAGKNVKAPLEKNDGEVNIGMGSEPALQFWIPEGETSSSDFLKLFVSTQYLDLDWIKQEISPFDPTFCGKGRAGGKEVLDLQNWDALEVVLQLNGVAYSR